mmetsp:Transcript_29585/g.61656  ORF Transcript_29585/g.61656 Transcript_29585/m.61656 type:complete len:109 (+) Transcript_29585:871-1197(+)
MVAVRGAGRERIQKAGTAKKQKHYSRATEWTSWMVGTACVGTITSHGGYQLAIHDQSFTISAGASSTTSTSSNSIRCAVKGTWSASATSYKRTDGGSFQPPNWTTPPL